MTTLFYDEISKYFQSILANILRTKPYAPYQLKLKFQNKDKKAFTTNTLFVL